MPKQLVWIINQKLNFYFYKVFKRLIIKLIYNIEYPIDPMKIDIFCIVNESVNENIMHVIPINSFDAVMIPCKFILG